MKIKIGPYRSWVGPYQIADKIVFWDEDKAHKFGRFLSTGSFEKLSQDKLFDDDAHRTWLHRLCVWIDSKKKRTVKIHIDDYDVWNADSTLSLIILPLLKRFKDKKQGSPFIDDEDVPEEIRSDKAEPKEHEWDTDSNHHKRWDWVIDEMIWAFEQIQPDYDWEDQYSQGKIDFRVRPTESGFFELHLGPEDTYQVDREGRKRHADRIQNGLRLFGKYYQTLWT